jgi:hypothetical protein
MDTHLNVKTMDDSARKQLEQEITALVRDLNHFKKRIAGTPTTKADNAVDGATTAGGSNQ